MMLHRSNLLVADAAGQGGELLKRDRQRKRREWINTASNFLAIRFRGIDPDRLLSWLNARVGWMFSPMAAVCASGDYRGADCW